MGKYKCLNRIIVLSVWFLYSGMVWAKDPYEYLKEFCKIGERVPGTTNHLRARDFILQNLKEPEVDSFIVDNVQYFNIYKRFPGKEKIAIAGHWDSDVGCPGANDGGSSVALLLSLADTLTKVPPDYGIDLLFFDGEDVDGAALYGSEHFASRCVDNYLYIVVIDMVGDRNLQIYKEGNSVKFFPQLVDSIWRIGKTIAPEVFMLETKYYIKDDHISLIKYGLRAIDIIDFDYPYWDSNDDTIDKCSRESLHIMQKFLLHLIYQRPHY